MSLKVVIFVLVTIRAVFLPDGEVFGRHISVNSDAELQKYLCYSGSGWRQPLADDQETVLLLKQKKFYLNSSSEFCIVRDFTNLTVKSDFDSTTIACSRPARFTIVHGCGLAFMNGVGLNLEGIKFISFGSAIDSSVMQEHNSTALPAYFGTNQTASIIFSNVTSLNITSMSVTHYYGFGLIFVNCVGKTLLTNIVISSSLSQTVCDAAIIHTLTHDNYTCFGSGLLVYYHDIVNESNNISYSELGETMFTLIKSSFENNIYKDTHSICITNVFQFQKDRVPIVAGAGITVYTTQSEYRVSIEFDGLLIVGNDGAISGGIATIFINTPFYSSLAIRNTQLKNSNNSWFSCFGESMLMYVHFTDPFLEHAKARTIAIEHFNDIWTPLSVINTNITDNVGANRSSSVYLGIRSQSLYEVQSIFDSVLFTNNQAFFTGICMYAETIYEPMMRTTPKLLQLHLKNINSTGNSQVQEGSAVVLSNSSQFVFYRVGRVLVEGEYPYSSSFVNNLGSVLDAFNSEIYLKGSVEFINNSAAMGAAILLRSGSFLTIGENSTITFHGNIAYQNGGAIYSSEKGTEDYYCLLQIDAKGRNISESNIHIDIKNNSARGSGHFAYMSPLFHCFQARFHVYPSALSSFYSTLCGITEEDLHNEVGTDPGRIHVCCHSTTNDMYHPKCNESRVLYEVFPGDDIVVHLVAYDDINNIVTSQVNASMSTVGESSYYTPHHFVSIGQSQVIKFIVTKHCTPVRYTIYSSGIPREPAQLNFAVPNRQPQSSVQIKIKPCPPGFQLNSVEGICECMNFFDSVDVSCNASTKNVQRNSNYNWIGVIDSMNSSINVIGYAEYCPVGFCNTSVRLVDMSKSSNTSTCINNREGTICGNCIDGYSVAHGNSGECIRCTNRGLWWLIGYFSSGIIMVLIVFIFKLTIDRGTIAGIVFYANMFRIVKLTLDLNKPYFLPFVQLIELLNLHQAFASCFVEGMEYAYIYVIEYCYSFYLWSIVIVIIVVARCSTRLTKLIMGSSVQVLMTAVHLSFIKVLISVIDTFTYAQVWFDDNSTYNVWLYNGTIHYGQGKHLPLLVTACFFSVVVIIPFLLIGTFGSLCLRFTIINKIRPVIDTIHGPYKDQFRYWYGVRLLLLVIVAVINPLLLGIRDPFIKLLIQLFLVILFTLFQVHIKPFIKAWINVLDLWCMVNVISLLLINLYGLKNGGKSSDYLLLFNVVLVSLTILGVFAYHAIILVRRCLVAIPCTRQHCIESPRFMNPINSLYRSRDKVNQYADIDKIAASLPAHTHTDVSSRDSSCTNNNTDGTTTGESQHELSTCNEYCNLREPLLEQ